MMTLLVSCLAQMAALSMRIYMTWYLESFVASLGCFFNFVLLVVEFDALIDVYLIRSNSIYLRNQFKKTAVEREEKKKTSEQQQQRSTRVNVAYSYPQKPSLIKSILNSIYSALFRFHQDRKKVE